MCLFCYISVTFTLTSSSVPFLLLFPKHRSSALCAFRWTSRLNFVGFFEVFVLVSTTPRWIFLFDRFPFRSQNLSSLLHLTVEQNSTTGQITSNEISKSDNETFNNVREIRNEKPASKREETRKENRNEKSSSAYPKTREKITETRTLRLRRNEKTSENRTKTKPSSASKRKQREAFACAETKRKAKEKRCFRLRRQRNVKQTQARKARDKTQ